MPDDKYLAQPPSACCFIGHIHAGEPRGVEVELAGVQTYVTRPPTGVAPNGHIVLYYPDIWALSNNAKLLMDGFAAAGYTALGIDYFRDDPISKYHANPGDPPPAGFDRKAWRDKHFSFAQAHVPVWTAAVKAKYGTSETRYACVGYCFGAPFVLDQLAAAETATAKEGEKQVKDKETNGDEDGDDDGDDDGNDGAGVVVSAGAVAHPSQLKAAHFEAARRPLFLSCAEHDRAFETEPRRQAIDILMANKTPYHEQLFYNVSHGFAARGNLSDPYERWVKVQSLQGIINWFDFWLIRNHQK
ncbi:MAG: hypothetical protein STHCBS139747_003201 [Sporothrix thermara]